MNGASFTPIAEDSSRGDGPWTRSTSTTTLQTPVLDEVAEAMVPYLRRTGLETPPALTGWARGTCRGRGGPGTSGEVAELFVRMRWFSPPRKRGEQLRTQGLCDFHRSRGNHIITTKIEHPRCSRSAGTWKPRVRCHLYPRRSVGAGEPGRSVPGAPTETILISVMLANTKSGRSNPCVRSPQ